jgi:hypothetical protein
MKRLHLPRGVWELDETQTLGSPAGSAQCILALGRAAKASP